MEKINAHNKSFAKTVVKKNLKRIRGHPTEVTYESAEDIFKFKCLTKGKSITLKANSERPIKYLSEPTYGTGLIKDWITEVKKSGSIKINSTRGAADSLNWFVYKDFIAFFTTNDFRFIYVDEFINLKLPSNWQFKILEEKEGLFGGVFELSNDANKIIKVDCGFNNGNSGPKIYINDEIIKGIKYFHDESSFNKLINDLEIMMNS